jgi:hypothetical protein
MNESDQAAPSITEQTIERGEPLKMRPNKFCLSQLAHEYEFFNHGLLFTTAGFEWPAEDPLGEWRAQNPDAVLLLEMLPKPWIRGLADWSNVVVAVGRQHSASVKQLLSGIVVNNKGLHRLSCTVLMPCKIVDPTAKVSAKATINVVGLDSNHGFWYPMRGAGGQWQIGKDPARLATKQLAHAIAQHGDLAPLQLRVGTPFDLTTSLHMRNEPSDITPDEVQQLRSDYTRHFGDPNSASVKLEIQRLIDHWNTNTDE